jgi:hypothetical protein
MEGSFKCSSPVAEIRKRLYGTHTKGHVKSFQTHILYANRRTIFYSISLPLKSRRMRWVGHVARMGEDRGVHRVLVGKPEGKMPLGRPRRRWEDIIKMDLQ